MKFLLVFLAFFAVSSTGYSAEEAQSTTTSIPKAPTKDTVVEKEEGIKDNSVLGLSARNTVLFRGAFRSRSVAKAITKLYKISAELPKQSPIYLFLDSPGGSVSAGLELIQAAKALPQEVKTITLSAYSMGFITAMSLGERLILPYGSYMSHRARGRVFGQFSGELESRYEFWNQILTQIELAVSSRIGMTLEAYRERIVNEWWSLGSFAQKENLADKVVWASCDPELNKTSTETLRFWFGSFRVTWSDCPLISGPLEVVPLRNATTAEEKRLQDEFLRYLNLPTSDQYELYHKTNKFEEFRLP